MFGCKRVAVEVGPAQRDHTQAEVGVDQPRCRLGLGDRFGRRHRRRICGRDRSGEVEEVGRGLGDRSVPWPLRGGVRVPERQVHLLVDGFVAGAELRPVDGHHRAALHRAAQVQRERLTDLGGGVDVLRAPEQPVEPAAEPAARRDTGGLRAHPVRHRGEVGQVRVRVADPLDDRDLAAVPTRLDRRERRVQARGTVQLERLAAADGERAVLRVVVTVVDRDHGVETIVPTEQAHHHEDAVVTADRGRCPGGRVVAEEQFVEQAPGAPGDQSGAEAHADHLQEAATVERGAVGRLGRVEMSGRVERRDVGVEHGTGSSGDLHVGQEQGDVHEAEPVRPRHRPGEVVQHLA
jgi:hypothetical protein